MPDWGYLIIAISILAILAIVFVISFILYRKTPVPKGCEDILIEKEKCSTCNNASCPIKRKEDK